MIRISFEISDESFEEIKELVKEIRLKGYESENRYLKGVLGIRVDGK